MKQKIAAVMLLVFGFGVLFISVFRTAQVKYSFRLIHPNQLDIVNSQINHDIQGVFIDYYLPYPGPILPDNSLWRLKSVRDRLWLLVTFDPVAKSELNLLLADKRLVAAKLLFDRGQYELGLSTLSKAEKYLEKAVNIETVLEEKGIETLDLTTTLIKASLKHRQIIKEILLIAPDDAKTEIIMIENYPRGIYGRKIKVLEQHGVPPINDPFNGL